MSKLKSGIMSLGARGTVADTLTYQVRKGVDIVRKKPIPTDRRTLLQIYQRWLYEDYAYLWRQQSVATKQSYATAGSRHHLTGFQYWMKYQLSYLPDIIAMYHLDNVIGGAVIDFSRNANTGTVVGAWPGVGIIDRAFCFDGINDRVDCGLGASLEWSYPLTVEVFGYYYTAALDKAFYGSRSAGEQRRTVMRSNAWAVQPLGKAAVEVFPMLGGGIPVTANVWHHLVGWYNGATITVYLDGAFAQSKPCSGVLGAPTDTWLGATPRLGGSWWLPGRVDHVIIYNRILDDTEILRHSERSYQV